MSRPALTPLERQVRRVTRRLFLQTLLDRLVWCWAGGLALAAGAVLVQRRALPGLEGVLCWEAAGGLALLATGLGVALAVWAAPSRLAAGLALDERFKLRERVTTALCLS